LHNALRALSIIVFCLGFLSQFESVSMGAVWSTLVGDGGESYHDDLDYYDDAGDFEKSGHSHDETKWDKKDRHRRRQMEQCDLGQDNEDVEQKLNRNYIPGPGATDSGLTCKLTVIETAWGRGLATTCPANVRRPLSLLHLISNLPDLHF
jgi:hypothetical protein